MAALRAALVARRPAARLLSSAVAARRLLGAAAAALTLELAPAAWGAVLLRAQVLQSHLQTLAQELAPGHRPAFTVAAAQSLALAAARLLPPHRRALGLLAARPLPALATLAALPTIGAPIGAFVASFVAQLLAALLQPLAHRLEALFGLLQAFALFGARGRLAVSPRRLLALLGGGEREEQTQHEHQVFHCGHSHGALEGRGQRTPHGRSHLSRPRELSRLRPRGAGCRQRAGAIGLPVRRLRLQRPRAAASA